VTLLEKHICKSHIRLETKVRLYSVHVLPVLMYGSEVCQSLSLLLGDLTLLTHGLSVKSSGSRIPDMSSTLLSGRLPAVLQLHRIRERRLRCFGHVARADPKQDQHRVIGASLRPPSDWRRPCGRPRTSWLSRATDSDVQSVNIGIHSAWSKASDRARSGEYYRRHGNTPSWGTPLKNRPILIHL